MANSEQLRKKRGALRAGVTRALTLLTDLLQQPDPDASQISGHMDYLKDKETALSQLDDVVLATTDEENLDQEVGTAQEYNEKILYAVSRAKFWLQELEIREEGRQLSRRALQDEPRTHMPEKIYGAEPIPSASALTGSTLPVTPACPLCQSKDHMIAFCDANLSAEEKRARLQYANCCFLCGTRNHIARLCRKSINLSALFVSSSETSAADLDVPSMWCLDAIGIDEAHSRTLEGSHHLFGSELGISKRNKNHPVDNAVTSGRKARISTLILDARVVVIGGRIGVTPHLRNLSQIGYFLCEHHDEDRILEILHAEYIFIKHVKNALHAMRVGPKDGKGEQALPKAKRAARRNSCAVCRLRKPVQERFDRTTQMERKGRNSSFDGNVNAMEDNLAQVNDLGHVPLFELLPISGEDTSVVSLDEPNEASTLLVSTLGLEGTCMELLQQSFPKTTEGISQRKRMPLEELESVEKMFDSVNQPFLILPKLTEPGNCQVLPNKNCEIGMDTNVVHVYENENAVAEKAMNSSYVSLPQLINDLNNIGLMITDRPLKSSRCHWHSWKSIRPRRRLESKLDELQQLISSEFLLGSRHISVPQRASASGLANALPLQR
ncbi:hypothetical protein HPB52_011954 [Rhipicephalus sanguineus]|uniref:CCHC-type domain-containing protein n=1 Tax=Rhipicephalus sanguineus TaxID=34632 RepID=A0A9D4Q6H1_RHISA|nr:hypothetical protein HPB52_011954 [Rhipicephalus sanguineus]